MNDRELIVLRKQREHDKIIVTETSSESPASVIVVCKKEHNYYVYRYFVLEGEWLISIDAEECGADKALETYTRSVSFLL